MKRRTAQFLLSLRRIRSLVGYSLAEHEAEFNETPRHVPMRGNVLLRFFSRLADGAWNIHTTPDEVLSAI